MVACGVEVVRTSTWTATEPVRSLKRRHVCVQYLDASGDASPARRSMRSRLRKIDILAKSPFLVMSRRTPILAGIFEIRVAEHGLSYSDEVLFSMFELPRCAADWHKQRLFCKF